MPEERSKGRKLKPLYHVTATKKKGAGESFSIAVTIPKALAEELRINPGDPILAKLLEAEVDGKRVKGVFFYKP